MIAWLLSLIWVPLTLVVIGFLVLVVEPITDLLNCMEKKKVKKDDTDEPN